MKGKSKTTESLVLLETTKIAAPKVKKFGDGVAAVFAEIARQERMNPQRAILVGMALPVMKASMPHGEFRPWLEANVTRSNIWTKATGIKNASLYTRLAAAFVKQAKLDGAAVLSITNGSTIALKAGKNEHSAKLLKTIEEFVGEKSLAELLKEHVSDGGSSAGGSDVTLPADDNTLLGEVAEWFVNLRKTLVDPDTLKRFTPAQLTDAERQLADLNEDFRKARETLNPSN